MRLTSFFSENPHPIKEIDNTHQKSTQISERVTMKVLSLLLLASAVLGQRLVAREGGAGPVANTVQSSSLSTATSSSEEVNVLEFSNLGFEGSYQQVSSLTDLYSDDCSCEVSSDTVSFSGSNAPLNEELSIHFRGPLVLHKFAYYVSADFEHGDDDSGDWTRLAYYDASEQTALNVTFLTKAGKNSTCLGKALTYADSDGVSAADEATVLAENTLINSNDEYVIFSNILCDDLGINNDCGVYRSGIPAYHGFYGTTKMFLFEFEMPTETNLTEDSVSNYDMPAIWLLNAHIPRTSQYSNNVNCSCWRSGCGEFDVFEAMNTTESSKLFTTLHDYQGTDDIESGLPIYGHIKRLSGTMIGGVAFDKNGNAIVWQSNSTDISSTIKASDLNSWINDAGDVKERALSSVTAASTASTSSKTSAGMALHKTSFQALVFAAVSALVGACI